MSKKRLDVFLMEKGLAASRTHAQELIEGAQVYSLKSGQKIYLKKSSHAVTPDQESSIAVEDGAANRFVSRGGLKLEGALLHVGLDVTGWAVLDVGISTGGFTDCLLQKGARQVLGVDVGHGQVHSSLLSNSRLRVLEGINARALSAEPEVQKSLQILNPDLVVMDVSFISITLIIPELSKVLHSGSRLLSLVKPQFEVGVDGLAKGGIVKDTSLYAEVKEKILAQCAAHDFEVLDYFDSPIQGKDGNNEFFVFAKKI